MKTLRHRRKKVCAGSNKSLSDNGSILLGRAQRFAMWSAQHFGEILKKWIKRAIS